MVHVRLTQSIANRVRTRLFHRLTLLPMTVLDDQRIGDSVFRVLYDVPEVPDLAYRVTLTPFFMGLGALISLYILQYSYGAVAPELIWIAWFAVPAAFVTTFPFSGALRRTNQNKRAAGSAATNAMEESITQVGAVQSLGASTQVSSRFASFSDQTFLRERYAIAVIIFVASIAGGVFAAAAIYVTILVSDQIIENTMTPGDFAVLLGIYYQISSAAGYYGAIWIKLQETLAAVRRVFFFLDYRSEENRSEGQQLDNIQESVVLEDVSFDYPDGKRALDRINVELPINKLVAIVGPTGAGKTTLAYLIPSLLTPTSGRILIDGIDIRELNVDSLRRHVTYVFQEHVLLSDTVRENLLLANPDATESKLHEALETAGCNEFLEKLPDGIDTVLGRSGDTLSVGQQQRLSIARGLVRDAKILILDEPTAALDPQTEQRLVGALENAAKDRLVIVIAHRLSTIRHADRIIFLEDGRIVESGSEAELMARPDGRYRTFVELQQT
ncbi:MAG TPA: ABC transporter ATP-binding protein [Pseudomonadales bacterium]|nr:ABC transporter ATP-binding protein [Pseudomonadales bacterium]